MSSFDDRSKYPAEPVRPIRRARQASWADQWARTMQRLEIEGVGHVQEPKLHPDAHWLWHGARQSDGRAVIRQDRKVRSLVRVLWAEFRGGQPDTRKVAHRLCDQQDCVNPWHYELTQRGSWLVDQDRVEREVAEAQLLIMSLEPWLRKQVRRTLHRDPPKCLNAEWVRATAAEWD